MPEIKSKRKLSKAQNAIKRENWISGYHVVVRNKGRFVHSSKWHGKESTKQALFKVQRFESGSRFIYVVSHTKSTHGLTISSPTYIHMGSIGSPQRKWLYENIRKKYSQKGYDFSLGPMKLVDTYDANLGERVR